MQRPQRGALTNLHTLLRFLLPFSVLPKTHWTIQGGEERGGVHRQGEKQDAWMVSLGKGPSPKALASRLVCPLRHNISAEGRDESEGLP